MAKDNEDVSPAPDNFIDEVDDENPSEDRTVGDVDDWAGVVRPVCSVSTIFINQTNVSKLTIKNLGRFAPRTEN